MCVCVRVSELFWGKYYKTQTPVSVLLIRMLFAFAFCRQRDKPGASLSKGAAVGGRREGYLWVVAGVAALCVRATHMKNILEPKRREIENIARYAKMWVDSLLGRWRWRRSGGVRGVRTHRHAQQQTHNSHTEQSRAPKQKWIPNGQQKGARRGVAYGEWGRGRRRRSWEKAALKSAKGNSCICERRKVRGGWGRTVAGAGGVSWR